MSNLLNKIKEAVTHDQPSDSTNAGPHNSNVSNTMDPLVDSDRDGRLAHGNTAGATTGQSATGKTHGTSAGTNAGTNSGYPTTGNTYGTTAGQPAIGNTYGATTGTTAGTNTGVHTGHTAAGNTYGTATGHPTGGNAYGSTTGTTTGTAGYSATGNSANAGPHNTNVGNKVDPRVDSDLDGRAARDHGNTGYATSGAYGSGAANNGPHNSKTMNKIDPRVDSDRVGRNAFGGADTTTKSFEQSQTHGTSTSSTAHGLGSSNQGSHKSNTMNKLDPRVDSSRDQRAAPGGTTGYSHPTGTTGTAAGAGMGDAATGYGRQTRGAGTGSGATTTAGPHSSNIANEIDPRVDSDRSNYATTGGPTTGTGTGTGTGTSHQYNTRSTNAGPHDTNMANKADPRVDSDMDNRARHQHMGNATTANAAPAGSSYATQETGQTYGTTGTSGTKGTTGTTGPHKSSLLNKLDPHVDSTATGNAQR